MNEGRRWLIVGRSGSGKTTYAQNVVRALGERLGGRVVIVNTRADQLRGLAPGPVIRVDQAAGERPRDLAALLERQGGAHFVLEMYDPNPFLDRLGRTIVDGFHNSVLVLDEAHLWINDRSPASMKRVISEGRSRNIHTIMITQQSGASGGYGLATVARNNVDVAVMFQVNEANELTRLTPFFPAAKDILPTLPSPGGYIIRDTATGETVRVDPDGREMAL